MGATELTLLERIFTLAIGPYGGSLFMGLLIGMAVMYWFFNKHIMPKKLESAEALCTARIDALQKRLDIVEPIAKKWEKFMERKAFEALGDKLDHTNPGL